MKKLTVYDATKEELIQYFFHPIDGGFRIPSDVERFCIWLQKKRTQELIDMQNQTIDDSQACLHEYIRLMKEANDIEDIYEKMKIFERACVAYKQYEKLNKNYEKIDKQISEQLSI